VYYTLTPNLPTPLWTVHPVDNSQLTTVTNLLTNRTYAMKVLASTDVGDGPLSDPLSVTTNQGGTATLIAYLFSHPVVLPRVLNVVRNRPAESQFGARGNYGHSRGPLQAASPPRDRGAPPTMRGPPGVAYPLILPLSTALVRNCSLKLSINKLNNF